MRKVPLINEEIYHIYNRGVDKRTIFSVDSDLNRFLLSMKYFNTKKPIGSIYQYEFQKHKNHTKIQPPLVEIISYIILPNHFHFILRQKIDGGISEFMKRLLGGYTNYFNEKNKRSGSLFQGRFKSVHVSRDEYLYVLLGYVNYNNLIHNIFKTKERLMQSSIQEIKSGKYDLISKDFVIKYISEKFGDIRSFEKHCKEVTEIIKKQRAAEVVPNEYLFDVT